MNTVCAYYHSNKGLGIELTKMVGRKIFIEHYSYALHSGKFDPASDSLNKIKWVSLPSCLKGLSYDYIIGWLGWSNYSK